VYPLVPPQLPSGETARLSRFGEGAAKTRPKKRAPKVKIDFAMIAIFKYGSIAIRLLKERGKDNEGQNKRVQTTVIKGVEQELG
jgi:hypothetical protein